MKEKKEKMVKNCFVISLCCLCLLAMTPTAWADTTNNNSAQSGAVVGVVNAPDNSSAAGVINNPNIANELSLGLSFDSHNTYIDESEYINRQFPQIGVPGSTGPMQYFGGWKAEDGVNWNVTPIVLNEVWVKTGEQEKIEYVELSLDIFKKYPPTDAIAIVGSGDVKGEKLATLGVIVTPKQRTEGAMAIAKTIGMDIGADYVELLASSALKKPESSDWHIGIGGGGSGVIGEKEAAGISGASGTGFGTTSIEVTTKPYVQVRFWKDGVNIGTAVVVVPPKLKSSEKAPLTLPEKSAVIE
ncbi:hypothetical protein KJ863_00040 [Patescibacteria group bacterium]|nr:hypothetical protein [Patescibacteria group bacterium]MBU4015734.1 hypothetical protein [Patescibacteria group bacterium]MBU4072499.1 hypothetical protein [Patescibacteria group bacterium]MBU4102408.1 hypothetical protein [Patescibacteria group bacterium]